MAYCSHDIMTRYMAAHDEATVLGRLIMHSENSHITAIVPRLASHLALSTDVKVQAALQLISNGHCFRMQDILVSGRRLFKASDRRMGTSGGNILVLGGSGEEQPE